MSRTLDEQGVLAWAQDVLSSFNNASQTVRVVYGDQQWSARPALPYATVLKLSEATIGEGERDYLEETATTALERVSWYFEGTYSITVYGAGHNQMIQALALSIRSDPQADANRARGVVIVDVISGPRRLSTTSNGVTEDRSQMDIRARYRLERDAAGLDIIETLELTQNL